MTDLRGAAAVVVRADPLERALAVVLRLAGDDDIAVVDDGEHRVLRLEGGAPAVPALTRALVAEDVDVLEIRTVERSLEEVFFQLTGGHPGMEAA